MDLDFTGLEEHDHEDYDVGTFATLPLDQS
jgi:hypothetical protein